jgi:murein tripeptide amidase MpaA
LSPFQDVHGDEEIPANFIAGLEGIPSWDDRLSRLQSLFTESLLRHSPDFQTKLGYPRDAPGKANLTLCSKAVGERFKCLSLTFEQPFKDCACNPNAEVGWSPERAQRLGAAMLSTVHELAPHLR